MTQESSIILNAVKALLYPVVRLAMRHGLRFQELNSCMKEVFVRYAEEEISRSDMPFTISRASVITGLQRKDIKRIQDPGQSVRSTTNLLTRVIGVWQSNPDYKAKDGRAMELTFEGLDSQFAELVRAISADVSHYTVIFGLESSGVIEKRQGKVALKRDAYVPSENKAAKLDMLAQDSEDLIRAVEKNIYDSPEIPNLHVTTVYDNICAGKLAEVREYILKLGSEFHQKIRDYLAKLDKDSNPSLFREQGGGRVVVGSFSLAEDLKGER